MINKGIFHVLILSRNYVTENFHNQIYQRKRKSKSENQNCHLVMDSPVFIFFLKGSLQYHWYYIRPNKDKDDAVTFFCASALHLAYITSLSRVGIVLKSHIFFFFTFLHHCGLWPKTNFDFNFFASWILISYESLSSN